MLGNALLLRPSQCAAARDRSTRRPEACPSLKHRLAGWHTRAGQAWSVVLPLANSPQTPANSSQPPTSKPPGIPHRADLGLDCGRPSPEVSTGSECVGWRPRAAHRPDLRIVSGSQSPKLRHGSVRFGSAGAGATSCPRGCRSDRVGCTWTCRPHRRLRLTVWVSAEWTPWWWCSTRRSDRSPKRSREQPGLARE
jgi:hypothetical protein